MIFFGKGWCSGNTGPSASSSANLPIKLHLPRTSSDVVLSSAASASSSSSASCTKQLTPPPEAHYSIMQLQDDRLTEFFGGKPHRARALQRHTPPPYSCEGEFEKLPTACPCPSADDEPITLARYLFVYGFFFPVFWIVGVAIIFSPLRPTPEWEVGKSEEEKQRLLAAMRVAELKWAKRCSYAIVSLLVMIIVLVTAFLSSRG